MRVVTTTLATDLHVAPSEHPLLARLLRAALPMANPDFEHPYDSVRQWWIEIDDDGFPQRELGMNADGRVIVAGPVGKNTGFWTDSPMTFDSSLTVTRTSKADLRGVALNTSKT